ncbi:hypothetical protein DFH29DRAFT_529610 [Suillus ampliporus]|nr:hypothetical protein DFH29DRAFT_529610 [Suillus ampliporus]
MQHRAEVHNGAESRGRGFSDIDFGVYALVSNIIDKNLNYASPGIPRLIYYKDDRILHVETRSCMHEAPFNRLTSEFSLFLHVLEYDDDHIYTMVSTNNQLWSAIVYAVPDMTISIEAMGRDEQISVIGEFAAHPEVQMVIMVVIDEHHLYHSLERGSEAWRMLRQETSARSHISFRSLRGVVARSLDQPIVIVGHTWCHIASVRFHVWVRGMNRLTSTLMTITYWHVV